MLWFIKLLPVFNGSTTYNHGDITFVHTLAVDALLQGVGGVWNDHVYTSGSPQFVKSNADLNITHFEMINIIVALKLWGCWWRNKKGLA